MFQFKNNSKCFGWIAVAHLFVGSSAVFAASPCTEVLSIEAGSHWQGELTAFDASHAYRVDVPSAGVIRLEVDAAAVAEARPELESINSTCSAGRAGDVVLVEQSAMRQMVAFRSPGTYHFRIAADKPEQTSLVEYELATSFTEALVATEELGLDLYSIDERVLVRWSDLYLTGLKSDDDPDEVNPGPGSPWTSGGPSLSWISFHTASVMKSDDDPDEVNPGPGLTGGHGSLSGSWLKSDDDPDEVNPGPGFTGGQGSLSGSWLKSDDDPDEVNPGPGFTGGDPTALGRLVITRAGSLLKSDDDPDEVNPGPGFTGGQGSLSGSFLKSDDDPDEVNPGPGFTGGQGSLSGSFLKSDDDPDEVNPGPGFTGGQGSLSGSWLKSDDDPDEVNPGPGLTNTGGGSARIRFESDAPFDRRQAALLGWIAEAMAAEGLAATATSWTATSH